MAANLPGTASNIRHLKAKRFIRDHLQPRMNNEAAFQHFLQNTTVTSQTKDAFIKDFTKMSLCDLDDNVGYPDMNDEPNSFGKLKCFWWWRSPKYKWRYAMKKEIRQQLNPLPSSELSDLA